MNRLNLTEGSSWAGHYLLKKRLGRGSFASVWLAHDTEADIDVAIKIFDPDGGIDTQGLEEFKEEFRLVFNLNHTNILHISHYDVYQQRPYIILPLCKNGSAFDLVGKATEEQVWQFMEEVAAGLDYLHHQPMKIIHQDIKPANILIDDNGHFLITDFGISLKMHQTIRRTISAGTEQEKLKAISGTLAYMGPERFEEKPQVVMASDIWSLGSSAYELLENDVPFGEYGGETQRNTQAGQEGLVGKIPAIKANVTDELKQLIYRCLEESTWNRPTAAQIVEICRERKRQMVTPPPPPPDPKKKYKMIAGVIAAAIVVVAVAIMAAWLYNDKQEAIKKETVFAILCASADSIVNITQKEAEKNEGLIEGSAINTNLSLATAKYEEALAQGNINTDAIMTIKERQSKMAVIMDSCSVFTHLSDTISELYNEGRVMTADEFKVQREQMSENIKKLILGL